MESINQIIPLQHKGISLSIKREDLLHPFISGNKFRKLKYNLLQAHTEKHHILLTFGGAFSNHISAVAAAGKEIGMQTIGIIRGEELSEKIADNPTLQFARDCGMQFEFVSREEYRNKSETSFLGNLEKKFGRFYLIPEGGTNEAAIKGCEEILTAEDADFDFICCPVGTGGTISGLINTARPNQKILGFPALKGDFLKEEICKFARPRGESRTGEFDPNWELLHSYHFGGYGKIDAILIDFINRFYEETGVLLDPIYTGKMVFGVIDLIEKGYFPEGARILAIHTGGLQGINGMNLHLKKKNLPLIQTHD